MNTHDLIDQIDVRLAELVNLGRNIHAELTRLNKNMPQPIATADDLGEQFDASENAESPSPPSSPPPPSADVQAKVRNLLLQALFYLAAEKA